MLIIILFMPLIVIILLLLFRSPHVLELINEIEEAKSIFHSILKLNKLQSGRVSDKAQCF